MELGVELDVQVGVVDLSPQGIGMESIGHMGYFRKGAEPLWTQALEWLSGHRDRR